MVAPVVQWVSGRVFDLVQRNNLVYNTCWEDPRLDRIALQLGPTDTVLVITSAGCNALDYVLTGPRHIYAVDMNPRQNALLEMKIAGIRNLDFETFFQMFGNGYLPGVRKIYKERLRNDLSPWARKWWDRHIDFFARPRLSFYFRGTAGAFARMMNAYVDRVLRVRPWVNALLEAKTLEEQREIYYGQLRPRVWTRAVRGLMRRDAILSLLGVPRSQREQVEEIYPGGIAEYIEHCLDAVFGELPLWENYFWRVYMTGRYAPSCCPEYLKPDNFAALKAGLVDRISIHTDTVEGFLAKNDVEISRFVLLDHMDWLWDKHFPILESEWQWIVRRAREGTRLIWRSGALRTDFVDRAQVEIAGKKYRVGELLRYHREWAAELHKRCRVHTYASFHIADLLL
ncbi:MAG: BtaA family protein [Thermoguttaceae bacterium]|nr:BtaA family protein [Thermoguttaceae bacterium]MDW8079754.1 BtaA family protein [Thermoguttaceae bacterium]